MKSQYDLIDINNQINVSFTLFNDNQPHVNLTERVHGVPCSVKVALKGSMDIIHLLMVTEALDAVGSPKKNLYISYLLGARSDRHMIPGDSFDLKVIANLVNLCKFEKVYIVDPHSDVATALVDNSTAVSNKFLVEKYDKPDAVLIVPDAGATKKSPKYFEWNKNLVDEVVCIKHRDVTNGRIVLKVIEPEKCAGRNCIVIDDLCDGGATFLEIAKQIEPEHLTLMVTHGIFSKGLSELAKWYDSIIVGATYNNGPRIGLASKFDDFIKYIDPWTDLK